MTVIIIPLLFLFAILLSLLQRHFQRLSQRHLAQSLNCSPFTSTYHPLDPLFGLDLPLLSRLALHRGTLSSDSLQRHTRLGPTFRIAPGLFTPQGQFEVHTIDPANIRTITTTNFAHWGRSEWAREAARHIGPGILMNDGAAWTESRARLRPVFARGKGGMDDHAVLEPHVWALCAAIRRKEGEGEVEFQALAARFGLDVVTQFLFGWSTGSLLAEGGEHEDAGGGGGGRDQGRQFLAHVHAFEGPAATFIAVGRLAWLELLPMYRRLMRAVAGMKGFFRAQLNAVLSHDTEQGAQEPKGQDAAGISCFRAMKADGVPVNVIQGELQNLFFASFDTTTALLGNIVDVLGRTPDVQGRLRDEIAALCGRPPRRDEVRRMAYLQCVLCEALRLFPPIPSFSRRALVDTWLPRGGEPDGTHPVFIPAGTSVAWSVHALNRRRDLWGDDWAAFRPDRWCGIDAGRLKHFMPFGTGPRSCLGQQMALAEVGYVVVRLLQAFGRVQSTRRDEGDFVERRAVSLRNGRGSWVRME